MTGNNADRMLARLAELHILSRIAGAPHRCACAAEKRSPAASAAPDGWPGAVWGHDWWNQRSSPQ